MNFPHNFIITMLLHSKKAGFGVVLGTLVYRACCGNHPAPFCRGINMLLGILSIQTLDSCVRKRTNNNGATTLPYHYVNQ